MVEFSYRDENGTHCSVTGDSFLSRAIQHEYDHLNGATFLTRLSDYHRPEALRKYKIVTRKVNKTLDRR